MKILFVTDTIDCWKHGIWYHRQETPSNALSERGHAIKQVAMGKEFPEHLLDWPDTVIFGRAYAHHFDPAKWMREYKKRGARVLYDMDDDFWEVAKDNPSVLVSNAMKTQYEQSIAEADAIITPSKALEKKMKKHFKKKVFICPNAIDQEIYKERTHEHGEMIVGWMGAASHWKDLQIVGKVINDLSKKHDFIFTIQGLTGESLEAAIYSYRRMLADGQTPEKNEYFKSAIEFYETLTDTKFWHIPFMPPEMHPTVLSRADFDIGIAPLEDTEFNKGKSCIKFYEYAAVGTVTLASDVEPYKSEVNYRAKNTYKDWYKKLEKLLLDDGFRNETLRKQQKYVFENRTIKQVAIPWEKACEHPGGLETANQR